MDYTQLQPQYQLDTIAEAMYSREQEHYHYAVDAANFEQMLTQNLEPAYRTMIETRLTETRARMIEVDAIYAALKSQADAADQIAFAEAMTRTAAKRAAV